MSIIALRIPDELANKLAAAARQRGVSRSAIICDALVAYMRQAEAGSAADLLGDLIGAFEGPEDLSYRHEQMEDFGTTTTGGC